MIKVSIKKREILTAYKIIKNGGLAIVPTRVGYVLAGNSQQAITKMFKIKGRPLTKPAVILTRFDLLAQIAQIPNRFQLLITAIEHSKILCGFILKRKSHPIFNSLAKYTNQNSQKADGTSCFVINHGDYTQRLVDLAWDEKTIVVGSSANKSGTGNEGIFKHLPVQIQHNVEYKLEHDNFVAQEYDPVTRQQGVMIDLTGTEPVLIRKGLKCRELEAIILAFTRKDSIPFRDHNTGKFYKLGI